MAGERRVEVSGYRRPLHPARGTAAAVGAVPRLVPPLEDDRQVGLDIEAVAEMIRDGSLVSAVEDAIGVLE